ncbi:unnamed protein product [Acanthoscelides obtectus]|uniref:Uncharacterized protein n=1 Tax=Acanthoscelides obtectus TaxID=200917 RepID=A0A9P0LUE8_ACAOB|nr:unnamed protein product [Acanthoscelides obtectus]CAK1638439.1 hypothetical protein AOBTE_LOCUS10605 [Acanthoscelides obtectus]
MNKCGSESNLRLNTAHDVRQQTLSKKSVPILKSLYMEETFHSSDRFVKRYASCTEMTDHNLSDICDINTMFSTKVKLNSPPGKQQHNASKQNLEEATDCVPMEVDLSDDKLAPKLEKIDSQEAFTPYIDLTTDTPTAFDGMGPQYLPKAAYMSDFEQNTKPIKGKLISCSKNDQIRSKLIYLDTERTKFSTWPFLSVLSIIVSIAIYLCFYNITHVNSNVQLQHIKSDLLNEVYEQETAVEIIVHTLEHRQFWKSKVKVLGFIGTQGVGKTHIANILKRHFLSHLVHELYGPHIGYKNQKDKIIQAIDGCCLNLVIIDDMRREDDIELFSFVHSLPKHAFIIVIPIFNVQPFVDETISDRQSIIRLRDSFDDSGLYYELIKFHEFTDAQVEKWLRTQVQSYHINPDHQNLIVHEILLDHNAKYHGLKGLAKKLLLEVEKNK